MLSPVHKTPGEQDELMEEEEEEEEDDCMDDLIDLSPAPRVSCPLAALPKITPTPCATVKRDRKSIMAALMETKYENQLMS
jgi:hypothetical protein